MSLTPDQQAKFDEWLKLFKQYQHKEELTLDFVARCAYVEALKSNPPARWVSVKERLPEKCGEYFVMSGNRPDVDEFANGEWVFGNIYITHWMENPPTPTEPR